jgi:hypothetical protein
VAKLVTWSNGTRAVATEIDSMMAIVERSSGRKRGLGAI